MSYHNLLSLESTQKNRLLLRRSVRKGGRVGSEVGGVRVIEILVNKTENSTVSWVNRKKGTEERKWRNIFFTKPISVQCLACSSPLRWHDGNVFLPVALKPLKDFIDFIFVKLIRTNDNSRWNEQKKGTTKFPLKVTWEGNWGKVGKFIS